MGFRRSRQRLRQRLRLDCPSWRHDLTRGGKLPKARPFSSQCCDEVLTSRSVKVVAKSPVILLSYENPNVGGNRRVRFLSPSGTPSRTRYDC